MSTVEALVPIDTLVATAQDYLDRGMFRFARECLVQLYDRGHRPAFIAQQLGDCCNAEGLIPEAIHWFQQAVTLDPRLYIAQEHLIFLLDAKQETTDADALRERRKWWDLYGAQFYATRQPHQNWPHPEKRLRVGHVSGDFNFHSAAIAFVNVLAHYSPAIEPVFYCCLEPKHYDKRSRMWKEVFGHAFVDASEMSPSVLANTIRGDCCDILVDLAGFTNRNRLLTFAARPAPIQIQAWGYVLGTGSPAIDVVFADPIVASAEIRANLHERVVDLPALLTYQPRPDLPPPSPLPCLTKEKVVFSMFQRGMKVTLDCVEAWKEILSRVPDSFIHFKSSDYSPARRTWLADAFGDYRHRILFDFNTSHHEHMLWYQDVDLALDPWPQCGGVSTLEALDRGVVTVTWLGERMIQRSSGSFMTLVGFADDCVAHSRQEYIDKAVALVTTKRDRLAEMRACAQERMQASPIMTGYVEAVEQRYRELWREWCQKQSNEGEIWRKQNPQIH